MKVLATTVVLGLAAGSCCPCAAAEPGAGASFGRFEREVVSRTRAVGCSDPAEIGVAEDYLFSHIDADEFIRNFGCAVIPAHTRLFVLGVQQGALGVQEEAWDVASSSPGSPWLWVRADARRWRIL